MSKKNVSKAQNSASIHDANIKAAEVISKEAQKRKKKELRKEEKQLKHELEIQQGINSPRVATRMKLKEIKQLEAELRKQKNILREKVKTERKVTSESRKDLVQGKRAMRSNWITVRKDMRSFANLILRLEEETDVTELKAVSFNLARGLHALIRYVEETTESKIKMAQAVHALMAPVPSTLEEDGKEDLL